MKKSFLTLQSTRMLSSWSQVPMGPPDVIFGITEAFQRDKNPNKMNLGAGTYRDDNGKPFVLPTVRATEKRLLEKNLNKEYAPIEGIPEFRRLAFQLAAGDQPNLKSVNRNATIQSLSGTGALRLAGAFLSVFSENKVIWMPTPTWGNHKPIFTQTGLTVQQYRYYNPKTCGLDFDGCLSDLKQIPKGHTVLLHACAHNPTGVDPSSEQWREIGRIIKARELFPLFDFAYQGFASGDPDRDALSLRHFLEDLEVPTLFLCQSFAKNMGLYGERTGALSLVCADSEEADRCMSQLKILIRAMYSNPPIHGARIAAEILGDSTLKKQWLEDVKLMANRIISMRQTLVSHLAKAGSQRDWSHITNQIGMFCYSGLTPDQVDRLSKEHSVYLTRDGRISIAGLTTKNVAYLANAIHTVTK